eukprot:COSAG02_NODE_340_length_24179_cov_6.401644_9_plen_75_part_00
MGAGVVAVEAQLARVARLSPPDCQIGDCRLRLLYIRIELSLEFVGRLAISSTRYHYYGIAIDRLVQFHGKSEYM